jgi:FkbM family methyltransferase
MTLSLHDRLKYWFVPGFLYYPWKSYKEVRYREPELHILHHIVPRGRVAIDVGANRGYYACALSKIARRVDAFEPYPPAALFARRKLGRNVRVHEVAVSNYSGRATLHIPQRKGNIDVHFSATLKQVPAVQHRKITVQVVTIDQFEFDDVGFIKIDAEGSEMEVIDGARETIPAGLRSGPDHSRAGPETSMRRFRRISRQRCCAFRSMRAGAPTEELATIEAETAWPAKQS